MLCIFYTAGETSFEAKTEVDSNCTTDHSHDDNSTPYVCTVCEKWFTQKDFNNHMLIHSAKKSYSCTQCGKSFFCHNTV